MLVSATDLSSIIQYCNPAFVEVSGYTRDELIGQPHNLIRHPDMPREAFADMWATIRSGKSWSALVKNRRSNGDHYWVRANVTPIIRDGEPAGYLSVRTKPGRNEVSEAESLYARIRSGKGDVTLSGGRVVRCGALGFYDMLRHPKPDTRAALTALTGPAVIAALWPMAGTLAPQTTVAVASILAALTISLPSWLWARRTQRGIAEMSRIAGRLAAGDLTVKIPEHAGEMAGVMRGLTQLKVSLVAIVSDVRRQIDGMKLATREIAGGNMDLSNRTELQAASLEETAASLEQLTATVKNNSQSARTANSLVELAQTATRGGFDAVQTTEQTMRDIAKASGQITDIVTTIDSIAFQTNILALNAAVEAARAGESGKGFAVVAGEVRSLAQRCATAAREIKGIVNSNVETTARGSDTAAHATRQMNDINDAMTRVMTVMQEVTTAGEEQSQGIDSINNAIVQLDDATQQNAALVEQGAATAQNLSDQADVLDEAVRLFTLPRSSNA